MVCSSTGFIVHFHLRVMLHTYHMPPAAQLRSHHEAPVWLRHWCIVDIPSLNDEPLSAAPLCIDDSKSSDYGRRSNAQLALRNTVQTNYERIARPLAVVSSAPLLRTLTESYLKRGLRRT